MLSEVLQKRDPKSCLGAGTGIEKVPAAIQWFDLQQGLLDRASGLVDPT